MGNSICRCSNKNKNKTRIINPHFYGIDILDEIPDFDIGSQTGQTDYIDFIQYDDLPGPLVKGVDQFGRLFLSLRYTQNNRKSVITLFKRYSNKNCSLWQTGGQGFTSVGSGNGIIADEIYSEYSSQHIFLTVLTKAVNWYIMRQDDNRDDSIIISYNVLDYDHTLIKHEIIVSV